MQVRSAYLAGLAAFVATAMVSHRHPTPYNNYVLLADALLHGHAWVNIPGNYIDALPFTDGRYYIIEAPMPAILLLPAVALFGLQTNQTLLAMVLAGVAVGAAWTLGERFGLTLGRNAWICVFLLAGTDLLWCAMLGDVWFIAHVSSVAFTMLGLAELAGKRRPALVALWAVCAVESRFSMIAVLPVYAYLLLTEPERPLALSPQWRRRAIASLAVLIPAAALWTWYNFARWGTPGDLGYTAWYHQDSAGLPSGSPFRFQYLPNQLWSFFVQWPQWQPAFPYLIPTMLGTALQWTSPALILAFLARAPVRWTVALWVAAILTALPNFLYYVNGYDQFGMRHALDFEPFLVALMMLAVRDRFPQWGRALVAYSAAVGVWGCWFWNTFVRTS
jgi:hypothetical protein